MGPPAIACSASGKVLLTGGYLILDRNYNGMVFGLDARIHVHIKALPTSPSPKIPVFDLIVRSPQFRDARWCYSLKINTNGVGVKVEQLTEPCRMRPPQNKFVETAIAYCLTYLISTNNYRHPGPISITILADADYYSHSQVSASSGLRISDQFLNFDVPLHDAHKTGLGSSAALVTALVAAILTYYIPRDVLAMTSEEGRLRLHNLAQIVHCAAQGKVGSGFDVAAAVYGSCTYKRFSPSTLHDLDATESTFTSRLLGLIEDSGPYKVWDMCIDKASPVMPKGLGLLMCDVDCGSATVGMVQNVLAWRKRENEEARQLWTRLQQANEYLACQFENARATQYQDLRAAILKVRSLVREMSSKSNVPIEPEAQTKLIDAFCLLDGVVGGIVPGAGGFDAIALVVEKRPEVLQGLEQFCARYRFSCNDSSGYDGRVQLLNVREDDQGTREEDASRYAGWTELEMGND